jgi:hypothetical protein
MALRKSDVENAETCWVRTKEEGRALRMLLVLEQRERADVVEARARARGAERARVRRDIILEACLRVLGIRKCNGKEGRVCCNCKKVKISDDETKTSPWTGIAERSKSLEKIERTGHSIHPIAPARVAISAPRPREYSWCREVRTTPAFRLTRRGEVGSVSSGVYSSLITS